MSHLIEYVSPTNPIKPRFTRILCDSINPCFLHRAEMADMEDVNPPISKKPNQQPLTSLRHKLRVARRKALRAARREEGLPRRSWKFGRYLDPSTTKDIAVVESDGGQSAHDGCCASGKICFAAKRKFSSPCAVKLWCPAPNCSATKKMMFSFIKAAHTSNHITGNAGPDIVVHKCHGGGGACENEYAAWSFIINSEQVVSVLARKRHWEPREIP